MKKRIFLISFLLMFLNVFSQTETVLKDFYFEKSRNDFQKPPVDWQLDGDFALKRLGYWRGSKCGDVPATERVVGHIKNDTVFINYNKRIDPFCDSSIGLAVNAIDLVINIKKYPNYKNFIFQVVRTENCITDDCFIQNINDILQKSFITKKEITLKSDFRNGDETYVIYYDYNIPILIERSINYHTFSDCVSSSFKMRSDAISAKFYIKNWDDHTFVRVGLFKTGLNSLSYNETAMPADYEFSYNREKLAALNMIYTLRN